MTAWIDEDPTLRKFVRASRQLDELWKKQPGLFIRQNVFIVRNFTIEPIEPLLKVAAYRAGLGLVLSYSGYEPMAGDRDPSGAEIDAALVILGLEELSSRLATDFLSLTPSAAAELAREAVEQTVALAKATRDRHSAPVLLHNFLTPMTPAAGLRDSQDPNGQLNITRRMNIDLTGRVAALDGVHVLDLDHLFAQLGLRQCRDARGTRVSGAPLSLPALRALAAAQIKHMQAFRGPAKKCLIVDCDNTLWGGVVGEDGITGLALGESGPGRRHRDLQQNLLDLRRRGVILAIASKNEEADVLGVLRAHPDVLLSKDDFAAMRINWDNKVDNIISIAEELNLGLDHVVFLDDQPAECEWVRSQLPEVRVIEWPRDLEQGLTLDDLGLFDSLVLTQEDRARTELYRAEAKRRAIRQKSGSLPDYLKSLEMVATVGRARSVHLPRVAQLILRTNQFNLTTRRHDMAKLETWLSAPDAAVVWLDLRDRFGANGIVGCGILHAQRDEALIDTLLLSCRVIGRGAEAVMVHTLARLAGEMGCTTLIGEYIPSHRNALVASFYEDLGFTGPEQSADGTVWRWPLARGLPSLPDWLEVIYQDVADAR